MAAYAEKEKQIGPDVFQQIERWLMLRTIDDKWIDYLTQMEHFREGIGLRAYGQRDPLIEYKNEAFQMFQELTAGIQAEIVARMFRVQLMQEPPPPPRPLARGVVESGPAERDGASSAASGNGAGRRPAGAGTAVAAGGPPAGKIGRNDPCWCGSGKKYKRCHGR